MRTSTAHSENSGSPERGPSSRRLWRAVVARDGRLDGVFVYAVRSTGVYCRPSCPARRPRREFVTFFPTPAAAEGSGFRPCRRCRPRDAQRPDAKLDALWGRMAAGPPQDIAAISRDTGIGRNRLRRLFRQTLGITPREYAQAARLQALKRRLQMGDDVTTALYQAGYGSPSRLYESSNRALGMTPAAYRQGGRGMNIGYTVASSPLGRVLVAGTARGVSAVYMGDAAGPLVAALRREYPEAEIRRDPLHVSRWVRQIVRHLSGRHPALDVPLDVRATAFQRRVWAALQRIPYGATRSYHDISKAIGRPRATRAVARACATNPVSVVIPCHRVVRTDGGLGGYRWGIERKKALLALERAARHG